MNSETEAVRRRLLAYGFADKLVDIYMLSEFGYGYGGIANYQRGTLLDFREYMSIIGVTRGEMT